MSHEGERMHRPDPVRERPIRDFSTYARNHGLGPREDAVAEGVKLGYSVLDEQMREGQKLAERLRGGVRPGQPPLDFGALIERALNIYRDIGALAFAATEALARNSGGAARAPETAPASPAAAYAFEIKSSRRVAVKLDARPAARPRVRALQAALGGAPDIATVSFEAGGALRLEIADDQPAGVYNAVVVDADSGEPLGMLTVRIPT